MQPVRPAIILVALLALCLPVAVRSEEVILELDPGVTMLTYCDMIHNLRTCDSVHVVASTTLEESGTLLLDGEPYVVTWMGPGYYLETGMIVEPYGDPSVELKGQRWREVLPVEDRIHRSRGWRDHDRNKALSPHDVLILDGKAVRIMDVRLHVRAVPVSPEGPAPEILKPEKEKQ
jgi:hypothetical protein